MTIAVAEQGAAAAEAGASEASAGASQAARNLPRTSSRAGTGRQAAGRQGTGSQRRSQPSGAQQYLQGKGDRAKQRARSAEFRGKAPDVTSYQAVVLAEFVAAVLLVAATPFAKKDQPGVSPYAGSDMLQLVALTVAYFLLALISGMNRGAGRFAAWFGALILLTVGLAEAARLAKLLNVFGLSGSPASTGAPDSTGTSQAPGTTTAGGRG